MAASSKKPKLVFILGPTGVGKSNAAIDIALEIDAEIINGDSQQVYRYMDLGTGKPSPADRRVVRHHLIDIVDPDADFNAALFRRAALESIREIRSRAKQIIVCGGTGLYIRVLTHGLCVAPAGDLEIRKALEQEARTKGSGALYDRLRRVDAEAASRIHPNDRQRTIRALEVYGLTGRPISEWQREHAFRDGPFETLKIGLNRERSELYALIDRRCEEMVSKGLAAELEELFGRGYRLDLRPLQSVGYRHMAMFLTGEASLEAALVLMQRDTRHLAKRQLTWFRADREVRWFHPERDKEAIMKSVKEFLGR